MIRRIAFVLMLSCGSVFVALGQDLLAPPSFCATTHNDVFRPEGQVRSIRVSWKEYRPGYRMRKAGIILTAIGVPMLTTGILFMTSADHSYYRTTTANGATIEEGDPKYAFGFLLIVGGTGMTVPGAILWWRGAKKYKHFLQDKQQAVSFGISANHISLRYRF